MDQPPPTPLPRAPDGAVYACPYRGDVEAIRSQRRLAPALIGALAAAVIAIGAHSCAVSREAGATESTVRAVAQRQQEAAAELDRLRAADTRIERSSSEVQSQVLVQLGRLEAQLEGISQRLERVEEGQSGRSRR